MTKPLVVDKLLYTPAEAAHALGVSRSTLYVLMANGDVPSVRIGSSRRIPADGLRHHRPAKWAGAGGPAAGPWRRATGTAAPLEVTVPAQL